MLIELRGVEFVNRGAELMLHAIIKKVREKIPEAAFVMNTGRRTPEKKLRQNNINIKLNGDPYSKLCQYLPVSIRRGLGYIIDQEVNVVLDGSGFAFGDQWGAPKAYSRLGCDIIKWKKQGKKVILLPQAFGPFSDPELREVMRDILFHADLIFAREQQSYEYLNRVTKTSNLQIAPDFTNLVSGRLPPDFDPDKHQVAIIPNYKMIEKIEDKNNTYFDFLLTAIRTIRELGLRPYFLIHEGKNDLLIATKINQQLDNPLSVITNDDPIMIKGVIASAYFIVCSRFHGVVSALSQGVPCIVTSWSHKYKMLLSEYDYNEGLILNLGDHANTVDLIRKVADPEINKALAQKLVRCSEIQKERSLKMWEKVFEVINN